MAQQKRSARQVRIIGGMWKGRKLHFSGDASLRPTLGRTRETLFNWLRPYIAASRCLDAFAGSGVLGFEALSQGAGEVVFIERNPHTLRTLAAAAKALDAAARCTIVTGDAIGYLQRTALPFDIVFLDPPFDRPELLRQALELLAGKRLVNEFVYAEARDSATLAALGATTGFDLLKQTRSGDTAAALLSPVAGIAGSAGQG